MACLYRGFESRPLRCVTMSFPKLYASWICSTSGSPATPIALKLPQGELFHRPQASAPTELKALYEAANRTR